MLPKFSEIVAHNYQKSSCRYINGFTAGAETAKAVWLKIMLHMEEQGGIQSNLSVSSTPFGDHVGDCHIRDGIRIHSLSWL